MSNKRLQHSNSYEDSQRSLLKQELVFKKEDQLRLQIELESKKVELSKVLYVYDWLHISRLFHKSNELILNKIEIVQENKLGELILSKIKHNSDEVIYNYSKVILTENDKSLLCKGLRFAVPPKKLKYHEYMLPFELLFRDIKFDTKSNNSLNHLQSKVKDLGLSSLRYYNKHDHSLDNLTKEEYKSFLKLSENEDIIIQRADKGNTVVILDRVTYITKIEELLSNTEKFLPISFKHSINKELRHLLDLEKALIDTLDRLLSQSYLSQSDYEFLKPSGSNPGVLYGLCKVHKEIVGDSPPFRPILSSIGTSSYNLAKFFVPILKEYTVNEYTIKDSFSFAKNITAQNSSLYMASFDVDNLFTNIPLDETIEICLTKLFAGKRKIKGLLKSHCRDLLILATKQSSFIFNNKWYTQIDGVAMGSPLGPTLANIFLGHFESIWLENCPEEFRPVHYKRYVDDVFLLFKSRDHIANFKNFLNNKHKNINFTVEEEKDNKLSFLDILISRDQNKFITSIYRKSTFSGVYTNFKSFIPTEYKHGLIFSLLFRVFTISMNYNIMLDEIEQLKIIWLKNAFPMRIIDKCICDFFNKIFCKKAVESGNEEGNKIVTISLPYLGLDSLRIKKQLQNIIKTCCHGVRLRIIFSSKTRLGNLFNFKDRIPDDLKSLVLYKYTCRMCNHTYLGKCKRHFKVRRNEHLNNSFKTEKPYSFNKKTATAISDHIHSLKHSAMDSDFKIIGRAANDYHLKIAESLLIQKEQPILNKTVFSVPLHLFSNQNVN